MPADPPERKDETVEVGGVSAKGEVGNVTVTVSVSAAIPGRTQEQMSEHYSRAEAAPEIRAAGYEGFTVHDRDDGEYVTLLLYEHDPSKITTRLTVKAEHLVQIVDALTAMIEHRKLRR